jgi:hypothetical protein
VAIDIFSDGYRELLWLRDGSVSHRVKPSTFYQTVEGSIERISAIFARYLGRFRSKAPRR